MEIIATAAQAAHIPLVACQQHMLEVVADRRLIQIDLVVLVVAAMAQYLALIHQQHSVLQTQVAVEAADITLAQGTPGEAALALSFSSGLSHYRPRILLHLQEHG